MAWICASASCREFGRGRARPRSLGHSGCWLDREEQAQHLRSRDWESITAADLRGFLAATKPKPHRVHRLPASWSKFWKFLAEIQHLPAGNPPGELKRPKLPGRLPKYLNPRN